MPSRRIKIVNRLGLHARAAAVLVRVAHDYRAAATIGRADGGDSVNAKSIMGVLTLAAAQGSEVVVTTEGSDEELALDAIEALIVDRFGEEN